MAAISNSELKAAVSEIMERDQSETPLSQKSHRVDLSALRRTHHERLQSEFAKAGFDFSRLEKLHNDYTKEALKLLEKQMPSIDSKPVKPTKSDREWTENKKRVYELIGGRPLVTFPVAIDSPIAIFSIPSGALVDSHIESWNSWARWNHRDKSSGDEDKQAFLKFLFAWRNNSPNPVIIKNASADLSTRGFCFVRADPAVYFGCLTQLFFSVYHRAYVGTTTFSGDDRLILNILADADGYLFGGQVELDSRDINRVDHVRCQDIVVPGHGVAIFDVGVEAFYSILSGLYGYGGGEGMVQYLFTASGRRIACPSLVLEISLVVQS
jgi:hypothetical protein